MVLDAAQTEPPCHIEIWETYGNGASWSPGPPCNLTGQPRYPGAMTHSHMCKIVRPPKKATPPWVWVREIHRSTQGPSKVSLFKHPQGSNPSARRTRRTRRRIGEDSMVLPRRSSWSCGDHAPRRRHATRSRSRREVRKDSWRLLCGTGKR